MDSIYEASKYFNGVGLGFLLQKIWLQMNCRQLVEFFPADGQGLE